MPDSYNPRGYISTAQAINRVFESRHPELAAAALERESNIRGLYLLKSASKPNSLLSTRSGCDDCATSSQR